MSRRLPRGAVAGVLALPFLIGIAALRGLTVALPIFHSDDEFNYHLPTIRLFARQLPTPDLVHYHAAQTPLFHLVMAVASQLVGLQLWRLRLLEVLISYGLALAVHRLLRRRLELPEPVALGCALLFALSPYVLGTSFRVITDNLATLFIVLALDRCLRFAEDERFSTFALACLWVACAMLTRQSAAFMLAMTGWYALRVPGTLAGRARAVGLVAASVVPVAALFAAWGGIVPPNGDPRSCGLCSGGAGAAGLTVATPELGLATLGLYGAVLFAAPLALRVRRAGLRAARGGAAGPVVAGALGGVVLLLVFPDRPGADAAGLVATAARHVPALLGSSLALWVLIPAGGAIAAWRVRVAPHPEVVAVFALAFLIGALAIRYPWQKYVDPFVLLALVMSARPAEFADRRAWAGALVLALGFIVYAADPAVHRDTPVMPVAAAGAPRTQHGRDGLPPRPWGRPKAIGRAQATLAYASATAAQLTTLNHASM